VSSGFDPKQTVLAVSLHSNGVSNTPTSTMTVHLVDVTRDQAIAEMDGESFNVIGEGLGDGAWEVFPVIVYSTRTSPDMFLSRPAWTR